jgi:hypothetical protein
LDLLNYQSHKSHTDKNYGKERDRDKFFILLDLLHWFEMLSQTFLVCRRKS